MKINEVNKLSDRTLFEAIDPANNTGVNTNDLIQIVRAHEANQWEQYDSVDSFLNSLAG